MTKAQIREGNPRLREYAKRLSEQIDRLQSPLLRREHFEAFADYAPCLMWTADADGTMTFFNRRFREVAHFEGLDFQHCYHPEDAPRCISAWRESVRSRRVHSSHARLRTTDGSYRYAVSRATPILDASGEVAFWIGSAFVIADAAVIDDPRAA